MSNPNDTIVFRPMVATDIGTVPISHQGEPQEVRQRIADIGSSAILAFDGAQHVGQLQFRRYVPGTRSPQGLWHPLYWADFGDRNVGLPEQTLAVFCYHVGQLDDTEDRDPRYQGRGIGLRLLDVLLDWATRAGFAALVAKAVPTPRPIMAFMGGQTTKAYQERGFQPVASWVDVELKTLVVDRQLVPSDMNPDEAARVSCVVRRLG
jgi:GNAT superfamily N-acetyltransferase